jgi:hypothetical protein
MSGRVQPFSSSKRLPADAAGLRLCKIFPGDDLRLCEPVVFTKGRAAVDTVLRRAAISGRVEIEPGSPLPDHFADIIDSKGDAVGNVALDAKSFKALKEHWMRCKYEVYE